MPSPEAESIAGPSPAVAEIAAAFNRAAASGVAGAYDAIIARLAPDVEIRHLPPVAELDGVRSSSDAAGYLREELVAFPRAFHQLDVTLSPAVIEGTTVSVEQIHWTGTLRYDGSPRVDVGFRLDLETRDGRITALVGAPLPGNDRDHFISWLKATADAGGFRPPSARDR
jgi:ketosteroid isomerase-like protein